MTGSLRETPAGFSNCACQFSFPSFGSLENVKHLPQQRIHNPAPGLFLNPTRRTRQWRDGVVFIWLQLWLKATTQHRQQGQGNDERSQQREDYGDGLIPKQLSCHTIQIYNWQKNSNGGQGRGGDRHGDFFRSQKGSIEVQASLLAVAKDVFHHNNWVIHQHADTQCQSPDRHDIEADARKIKETECGNNRNRDWKGNIERVAEIMQENKQH